MLLISPVPGNGAVSSGETAWLDCCRGIDGMGNMGASGNIHTAGPIVSARLAGCSAPGGTRRDHPFCGNIQAKSASRFAATGKPAPAEEACDKASVAALDAAGDVDCACT